MRRFIRTVAWLTFAVLAAWAVAIVVLLNWDWNRSKSWLSERVATALQREFAIDGDLRVDWKRTLDAQGARSWWPWPHVSARDVRLGNPEWANAEQMLRVDEVTFSVSPWRLLARSISVPQVRASGADIAIERRADGLNNWTFARADSTSGWDIRIGHVVLDRSHLVVDDAITRTAVELSIEPLGEAISFDAVLAEETAQLRAESAQSIGEAGARKFSSDAQRQQRRRERDAARGYEYAWRADGTFRGVAIEARGRSGGVLALRDDDPFPIQARIRAGTTRIAFVGTLTDPTRLAALDLRLWLSGRSMADLYGLTGLTLPETPAFATEGHLSGELKRNGNIFAYEDFSGRVGDSDLSGSMTWLDRSPRPLLVGAVASDLLRFADLGPLVGADVAQMKATGKVLPQHSLGSPRWQAMDADVDFAGARVVHTIDLPIDALRTRILLLDGRLGLEALRFGIAGGRVGGRVALDYNARPMNGEVHLSVRNVRLKELLPEFEPMQTSIGQINGSLALAGRGPSIAALLGSSSGEVKLLIDDGAISKSLLETAGLNIANILITRLIGDRDVKIDCAASHFVVDEGVMDAALFVVHTDEAIIHVSGTVDMSTEELDLEIRPQSSGMRVLSLRSPLYARGTFADPDIGVKKGPLLVRGGAALALGSIAAPVAALLALIAPSHGEQENRCSEVLVQMQGRARVQ